jgi:hypothetical protein
MEKKWEKIGRREGCQEIDIFKISIQSKPIILTIVKYYRYIKFSVNILNN